MSSSRRDAQSRERGLLKPIKDASEKRQRKKRDSGNQDGSESRRRKKNDFNVSLTPGYIEAANNFCMKYCSLTPEDIAQEWEKNLKGYRPPNKTTIAFNANENRNRYKDMVCWDDTRVVLQGRAPGKTDYIHANKVSGDPFTNQFICTQGPLSNTIDDFWWMVWQEKVTHIIMLCEEFEGGKKKCERYYPTNAGETVETPELSIRCSAQRDHHIDFSKEGEVTYRLVAVSAKGAVPVDFSRDKSGNVCRKREVHLLQYKFWPDKQVPTSLMSCFRILRRTRETAGTSVIHCSAGVGRTGTLVAIEMLFMEIYRKNNLDVNLVELVQKLRGMRNMAVQASVQYVFVVASLAKYLSKQTGLLRSEVLAVVETFLCDFKKYNVPRAASPEVEMRETPVRTATPSTSDRLNKKRINRID